MVAHLLLEGALAAAVLHGEEDHQAAAAAEAVGKIGTAFEAVAVR